MHELDSFRSLSPDKILNCIESVGFLCNGRCVPLNSVENRVFEIGLDSGERVVAKFYRPGRWSQGSILEEHAFLFELAEEEIPVLTPWKSQTGDSLFLVDDMTFAIWPLQKGRIIDEFQAIEYENLGRLLGRLHSIGKVANFQTRAILDERHYAKPSLDFLLSGNFISNSSLRKSYESISLSIFEIYSKLVENLEIPFQRIHGDCHKGNLIRTYDSGLAILDFDDILTGPVVQDFWMLLPFGDQKSASERESFFEAYSQFADWNPSWLGLIEPLRGIRYVYYSAWIAKRWEDPSFPELFPHFGSEEYWAKEVEDLNRIYRNILESNLEYTNDTEKKSDDKAKMEAEDALTNKDFFWDM